MANTLKFGNGVWANKKGSTLAYNDENGNFKPLPFTTTRSTSATRVNKEGLIEVVSNEVPRIDYTDSEDGVFLLEKASTNLITYSEGFDNAYWEKNGSSVVSGFTSPKGDLSAFKLVEGTSSAQFIRRTLIVSPGNNTISIFAKADERDWILLWDGYTSKGRYFDIKNGNIGGFRSSAPENSSIDNIGNGWYRCSITVNSSSTYLQNQIYLADGDGLFNYNGDGTSGVYIYGAMLEQNSVASSYIPTQGAAVTRSDETASGSGNSEVFNDSEGVLFADISFLDITSFKGISISNGTNGNSIRIYNSLTDNQLVFRVTVNSIDQVLKLYTLSDTSLYNKISLKYKQNDFSVFINGFKVAIVPDGITFPSGTLKKLNFNRSDGLDDFHGKTKEIAYYDTVLTDLELETLTSYRSWESMVKELNLNIIHNE